MKILFVATFIPDTNYTRDLSTYFQQILKKEDKLFLCGPKGEKVSDGKLPKVDYVWTKGSLAYVAEILKCIDKVKPDVVHLQHEFKMFGGFITALLYPLLLLVLKLKGYPLVVTIHGVVAQKQVTYDFLETFNFKPNAFTKYVVIIFFTYIYTTIILLTDKVTVHAPALKEVLKGYTRLANKKVVVIEHGIREIKDLQTVTTTHIYKKFPKTKNKNIIMVFGLFSPRKGYEYLISAFEKTIKKLDTQRWVLAIVGDVKQEFYSYKEKILRLIAEKNLKNNIVISGYVDGEEIDEFYRTAKFVIIPAIVSFNTSGALSLTLAYKKPMIVANVKPLAAEVENNEFGILYENSGAKSLDRQLVKMIKNDEYKKLAKKLEKSVQKRHWTKIAKEHFDLYKSLV